jgi:L-seryl-tRNA(Ser) seleniumtransferase
MTRNEACYVSAGAAAGIAIAVAGCIAGRDVDCVRRLPHVDGPAPEVVVYRKQRNGYDQAARQTGARLVEVDERSAAALDAAISPRTVCVLYFAGAHLAAGALPLEDVVSVAHARRIPVLVDAAAQIPPLSSLWRFTCELGADAAIFSGGKGLRGPQASGLLLGTRAIVENCIANGPPNHSLGRPMKVGKEEMMGLLAAVEWSLEQDEDDILGGYDATVRRWLEGLRGLPGVSVERGYPSEAGQPHARAVVHIGPTAVTTRAELVAALWDGDPRIAVGEVEPDAVALNPQTLEPGEDEIVLQAMRRLLG